MPIKLEVWGDYACFSRPEMKVERVSYDVMTPSAARGLVEAIYWHPGLRYVVDRIRVCAPIRFTNVRRNEVKDVVKATDIKKLMEHGGEAPFIATPDSIQQRASLLLRDVRYVIEAHFEMTEKATANDSPGKFLDILTRRIEKGQFYHQPYFGTREFPAHFSPCRMDPECPAELKGEKDLGWMLLDLDYSDPENIRPRFFHAVLIDGVLTVPRMNGKEVRTG